MSLPVYRLDLFHKAYCEATGFDLPMNFVSERNWYDSAKMGLKSEDIALLIKHLKARIKAGVRHAECLKIRNLVGSDEAIADSLNEIAALKAMGRRKSFPPAKIEVLRSTGRETEPSQGTKTRHISEVFKDIQKQ